MVSWLLLSSPGAGKDGGVGSVFLLVLRTRSLVYTKSPFVQCQRWDKLLFILNHLHSKECSFKTREEKTFTAWWSVSLCLIGPCRRSLQLLDAWLHVEGKSWTRLPNLQLLQPCRDTAPTRKDLSCNAQMGLAVVYSRVFHVIAGLPFPKHQLEKLSSQATCYLNSPLRGTVKVHTYPTANLAHSLHLNQEASQGCKGLLST